MAPTLLERSIEATDARDRPWRRLRWARLGRRFYRYAMPTGLIGAAAVAVIWSSPWPATSTLRHYAASPDCRMARLVGLAGARVGQPGYWPSHDRDLDGIACEPYPRRRLRLP